MEPKKFSLKERTIILSFAVLTLSLFFISWIPNNNETVIDDPYNEVTWVDQNWADSVRDGWYFTSQGSEIFPYDWFAVLEQAGSTELFINNLTGRYGFIPGPVSAEDNPYNLPLGFVLDENTIDIGDGLTATKWVGINCATCHTGAINIKGDNNSKPKMLILDGGQAHYDLEEFKNDLLSAINDTYNDKAKFERFVNNVKKSSGNNMTEQEISQQLQLLGQRMDKYIKSFQTEHASGPGRIDAFGGLFNTSSYLFQDNPLNLEPVIAPASIPFIWYLHRQSFTQWGGQTQNLTNAQHLGRNTGEALGVFARAKVNPTGPFPSTVKLQNLEALEYWLASLESPQWPEEFLGKIDRDAAARGEIVFNNTCRGCHSVVSKDSTNIVQIKQHPLSVMGTDPAWNIQMGRKAFSGVLQGQPLLGDAGPKLDSITSAASLVSNAVANVSLYFGISSKNTSDSSLIPVNGYKAPILNGVWSTAPYLHNGSIPSLYEFLKAPEDRVKTFYVGTYDFDPVKVGFNTEKSATNRFFFDTSLPGNNNTGHAFAAKLTEQERRDLLEYLKTL